MASVGVTPRGTVASAAPIDNAAYLSSFPDVRSSTPVAMASASSATDRSTSPPTDPIFRSLFQGGDRPQPVSLAVQKLWGDSSSLTSAASGAPVSSTIPSFPQTPEVRPPQPLDLFSDRTGAFS
jgi:hypothetical protein